MPRVHCVSVVLLAACRPGVNHEDTFAFLQQIASSTPFTSDFFCIPVRFCVYFELVCGLETCRMVLLYRSYWKNINTPCLPPKATGEAHGLPRWWEESVRFVYLKALKKIVWFSQGLGSLTFHRKKKNSTLPQSPWFSFKDLTTSGRRGLGECNPTPIPCKQNKITSNSNVEPGSVFKSLWAAYSFCVFDSFPLKYPGCSFSRPYLGFYFPLSSDLHLLLL